MLNIKCLVTSTTITIVIITSLVLYIKRRNKQRNRIPSKWKEIGYVEKLVIFPLKSAHYLETKFAECTEFGLRLLLSPDNPLQLRDRSFAVFDAKHGEVKYCATIPALIKIKTTVHDENQVALNAPNMETLHVRIPQRKKGNESFVKDYYGAPFGIIDCGEEAAKWLSQYIAQKENGYRLGYHDASERRKFVNDYETLRFYKNLTDSATGLFAGLSSILVVNQASVNDYLKKVPGTDVTAMNFRPNIIVNGPNLQPYSEDEWDWMKIGENIIMRNVKECVRCVISTINQETGAFNSKREPLKTLSTYRMSNGPEKAPRMGIHTDVRRTGIVKTGDPVYIGYD